MPPNGFSFLFLLLAFHAALAPSHVLKRDSDGANGLVTEVQRIPVQSEQSTATTPLPSRPEDQRRDLNLSTAARAKDGKLFATTANSIELQVPSYTEVALVDEKATITEKTLKSDELISHYKETPSNNSEAHATKAILKFWGPQENSYQDLKDLNASRTASASQTVIRSKLFSEYSGNKTSMIQLMQADERFTTSAMRQKVTLPPPLPKQVKKTASSKIVNSTQKLKGLSSNLVPSKVFTTPKSRAGLKTEEKKHYAPTRSVQIVSSKKSYFVTTPRPLTAVTETSNFVHSTVHLNCEGISPPFESIGKNGTYYVRSYPASSWLSTSVITNNRILAELEARNKLQKYFDGDNEKGTRFNQTCPVLTQIKFKGPYSEPREKVEEYAVSFYVPWNGQSDVASPNDSEVLVDIVEERVVYVHEFKARVWEMTDSFLQTEARKLGAELRKAGEPFLSKYFYVASYAKSPTSEEFSRYEIWLYATRFRPYDVISARQPVADRPLNEITRQTRSRVCKGFECPSFEVLAVHKVGIQKRRYYASRFATYLPEFCIFTKAAIWRAFMPLHLYKHGVNSHFEVIGATRPAGIVHVKENSSSVSTRNGTTLSCNQTFTVSLYLPKRLHAAPPVAGPTAPRIKITELDDVIVYVQSVGGFLLVPDRIRKEVELFRLRLLEQKLCYRSSEFYLVVYDYITRFHGRLNEIWVVADRCPDSL